MGLGSVLQTALSGISAAELAIGTVGNNLANAMTDGFKQSRPTFSPQTPQTRSRGAAASAESGGANPVQIGSGVKGSGIEVDFSQGSLSASGGALDVALEGDGFFIVEGGRGEQLFTRDGNFSLNQASELVTSDGHRVLGFAVDGNFKLQTTELSTIRISPGRQAASEDGSAATLTNFSIGSDGTINGRFSDGQIRTLGQIRVARFANASGLEARGSGLYAPGANSGLPVEAAPGDAGSASLVAGARELSNTDVGENLVDLVLAKNQFSTSRLVLNVADDMMSELLELGRK
jgi:flagellar hook protein FlgE